jgi:ribosomal protein L29
MDSRNTFFTCSASVFEAGQIEWEYSMDFPSVAETNISAQKQSRPSSPSITSGITGTSPSTLALRSPSYAFVAARPTPDPHILELKEQLAELKTTIQAQQQQNQQPSAPPAPNPHSMSPLDPGMLALREQVAELKTIIQAQQQQLQQMSAVQSPNPPAMNLPPEIARTIQDIVMVSLSNFRAEFQNLHQTTSAPSPVRKKVCPNAQTSESHLSEASLAAREDDDATMDHLS